MDIPSAFAGRVDFGLNINIAASNEQNVLMNSILAICFAFFIAIADAWQFIKYGTIPPQGECPFADEMPKDVENAANFLLHQALKTSKISNSVGHLAMNEDKQNPSRMNSTCDHPFKFTKGRSRYSRAYYCEIVVQNVCYDYIRRDRFSTR